MKWVIDNGGGKACTKVKVLGDYDITNMSISYTTGN